MKALSARWSTVKRQAQAQQQMTRDSPSRIRVEEGAEEEAGEEGGLIARQLDLTQDDDEKNISDPSLQ